MRDVKKPGPGESSADYMTDHPNGSEPPAVSGISALVRIAGDGFSAVYRGRQTRTGRGVAVKILPLPFDRNSRAQFDNERARIGRLRHVPAILQVDDVDMLPDGRPYLVSELCTGSVAESIRQGDRLSEEQVISLGHELADALAFAHEADVVHGSITPGNMLFRRSGQVVLSDFGQALRQTYPGDPADSGDYAAPETLRDGSLTVRADLYGLGATLYAALTGLPPFPARIGEHPSERILRVISQNPPPIDSDLASPALAMLLGELLATLPEDRPGSAAAVAERLASLREARAATEDPSPPTPPATKKSRKNAEKDDLETGDAPADDLQTADAQQQELQPKESPIEPENELGAGTSGIGPEKVDQVPPPDGSTDWSELLDDVLFDTEPIDEADRSAGTGQSLKGPAGVSHRRRRQPGPLLVAAIVGVALIVGLSLLGGHLIEGRPAAEPSSTPTIQPSAREAPAGRSPVPAVRLLSARDRGAAIDLTWSGSAKLNYAVVVAEPGQATQVVLAHHARRFRVRVVPGRQYCFLVQATNGQRVVETDPRPIRGAVCKT